MKKTLITLLAISGLAMGVTIDSAVIYKTGELESSYTLSEEVKFSGDFTLSLTLNVEAVRNFLNGSAGFYTFANVHASTQGNAGILFENNAEAGLKVGVTTDNVSTQVVDSPNWSRDYSTLSSIKWENVKSAAITLVHDSTVRTDYYLTVFTGDAYTTFNGGGTNLKWSGGFETVDSLSVSTDYVTGVALFNSALTQTEVSTFHQDYMIPEPATATLSLLALAGLAARRRRR